MSHTLGLIVHDTLIALFQCQEALWGLASYVNGFTEDMEHMSHDDVFNNCEHACAASFASSTLTCHELNSQDFENHENCYRTGFYISFQKFVGQKTLNFFLGQFLTLKNGRQHQMVGRWGQI